MAGTILDGRGRRVTVLRDLPRNDALPPVARVAARDGVYEVRTTLAGRFVVKLPETPGIRDLLEGAPAAPELAEGFFATVPKAPTDLLARAVGVFRERPDTEALVDVVFDRRDASFRLVWTEHRATAASVDFDPLPETDDVFVYCQIHSHHRMEAFFSSTDDREELRTLIYGVVGRVGLRRPHALFRYSCGGHFRHLRAADLFAVREARGAGRPSPPVEAIVREP